MTLIDRCSQDVEDERSGASPVSSACRGELPLSLTFRHAGKAEITLRYELVGRKDCPLLIVTGGISAGRHVLSTDEFPEPGWWQSQSEALSLDRFQILSIDWIGADGATDFPIDPADQAEAIAQLLSEFAIKKVIGFVGASYGAMVGMQLAVLYPERVGALLAISAAHRSHPFSSACRSLQRQALLLGESSGDPDAGIKLARAMAMLTYRTPQEFGERFADPAAVVSGKVRVAAQDYLEAQGARHCRRMSASAYRRLSESIDLHQVDPAQIKVPLTLAAVDQDALVPSEDVRALADAAAQADFHLIRSRYGHDAFLKEEGQVAAILSQFLASVEYA